MNALRNLLASCLCLSALFVGASAATAQDKAPEKLTMRLEWTAWGGHGPLFLAQQKGWLKEAGLEVDIQDGNGSNTTVQLVGSGQFDVGHASLAAMMIGRDKGLPLKAFAVFLRKNDLGLLIPADSDIHTPKDLAGKKLIYTAGSFEAPFLDTFLAAGGLKRDQVDLLSVDASSKIGLYATGHADGVFTSIVNVQPAVAKARTSRAIPFADYGLPAPSLGLFATEETIKKRGAALKKLSNVLVGAWAYVMNGHEEEAVQALIKARPQAKLNADVLRAQIQLTEKFFNTPSSADLALGVMGKQDWQEATKTLADAKLIKADSDPHSFYVDGFVDPKQINEIARR
jgi:NitT/TauT family transport system substrate-binding protein